MYDQTEKAMAQLIPHYMCDAVRRYVDQGIPPGYFLTAVLENNLVEAYHRADDTNIDYMHNWVRFVYNNLPAGCWGSPEKVQNWIKSGGMDGEDDAFVASRSSMTEDDK